MQDEIEKIAPKSAWRWRNRVSLKSIYSSSSAGKGGES